MKFAKGLIQSGAHQRGRGVRPKQRWVFEALPDGGLIQVQARSSGEAAQLARTKALQRGVRLEKLNLKESPQ